MKLFKTSILTLSLLLITMSRIFAVTYYVSNTGRNTNNGTTTSTPWQTIAKVNAGNYAAGTIIAFKGGQTFTGGLSFTSTNAHGTAVNPVKITSYATGTATISSNNIDGFDAYNVGGLTIEKLNFKGTSSTTFV